eukprot:3667153-Pyramimonas_sp.AAC.1
MEKAQTENENRARERNLRFGWLKSWEGDSALLALEPLVGPLKGIPFTSFFSATKAALDLDITSMLAPLQRSLVEVWSKLSRVESKGVLSWAECLHMEIAHFKASVVKDAAQVTLPTLVEAKHSDDIKILVKNAGPK